jgi:membrane protein required for colicin V production
MCSVSVVSILDSVLLFFLSLFAIRGYFKGLFREVFSLLGLFLGFTAAVFYNGLVSALWRESWGFSPLIGKALSFIAIFFVVYILLSMTGLLIHRSTGLLLTGFNRAGGILFGTLKGAAFLALILFFIKSYSIVPETPDLRRPDPKGFCVQLNDRHDFGRQDH